MAEMFVWLFFGGLIGWIANFNTDTNYTKVEWQYVGLGVVGAIFGGSIARLLYRSDAQDFNSSAFLVSIVMAVILIGIVHKFRHI